MNEIREQILIIEQKKNIKLPNIYSDFLLKSKFVIENNIFIVGRGLDDIFFENLNNEDENIIDFVSVRALYGFDDHGYFDLYINNFENLIKRIPEDFIAIGEDLVGDRICLGIDSEYYNKVYIWEMENEVDSNTPQPYYDNMTLITNTFEEFLEGLFIDV